jgi:FtsH-binding integral membrane protein
MVMLVLGTMREVAGLFYPGLVGLLITALPAGFTQAGRTPAFLWVLLLVLAGVMVWLAMRLEKMRKEGRTSSQWLRELK